MTYLLAVSDEKPSPDLEEVRFLELMQLSRECDRREAILFRQGKAKFQLPGAGHEAIGIIAQALNADDTVYPYYRDRALMLARGTPPEQIALDYFAKNASSSQGRQMASHYSDADHNMVSCATPTALQCLPAAGTAWGIKLAQQKRVVICCIGDASTRQGEFYEALAFAFQEKLPIVFVVEDNGYGISTPTENMQPYALNVLSQDHCIHVNGSNVSHVLEAATAVIEQARYRHIPSVLWVKVDRLMSHTSSDDQRTYRSSEDLQAMDARDPIKLYADSIINNGLISALDWQTKCIEIRDKVTEIYERAEIASDPIIEDIKSHLFSDKKHRPYSTFLPIDNEMNMATAINTTLHSLLLENDKYILFGEDICDPKGGVFGLTKGLSKKFSTQVYNSPLAEATICGLAAGLALAGYFPIFELQFIDFVGTAFNQIVNQIATLRWRTAGKYKCPMVLIAPCGAYLGCGGPWHSQTNESWFAHAPGLKIAMPSSPQDAANILAVAAMGDDPVLLLLPKNLFFKIKKNENILSLHSEQAAVNRSGTDITIVSWGNCVELAEHAAHNLQNHGISAEVIDLRYISPIDWQTILSSVRKTRRLLVVHEDNRTCSLGQTVISECLSNLDIWKTLIAPPKLICRDDIHVAYNANLESLSLPQTHHIIEAVLEMVIKK